MKRHTNQSSKQRLGQFWTTNVDKILDGWEEHLSNKIVVDPFCGNGDLLKFASQKGNAKNVMGYDIEPKYDWVRYRDSLLNPIEDLSEHFVLTNPPYLTKNKSKGAFDSIYRRYNQNDLYKCFIASLEQSQSKEGIIIIPSNFLSESSPKARQTFFSTYTIIEARYWTEPVFEDATTGIVAFIFRRKTTKATQSTHEFPVTFEPEGTTKMVSLDPKYDYLWGQEFFDLLPPRSIKMFKTDIGMPHPNTNLVLGLLDKGKWNQGLSYNTGAPLYTKVSAFTTYQLTIPGVELSDEMQRQIVERFNQTLGFHRNKYSGLFLANFMGANQKILSRNLSHRLITKCISDLSSTSSFNSLSFFQQ